MRKPCALCPGDTVGLVAPSGCVREAETVRLSVKKLGGLGFRVHAFPSCFAKYGYLAGTDRQRADDINAAFADDSIKAVFCLRGGYGAARILDMLDYDSITAHPKVFVGYSDITALHIAFGQKCGFVTFHGPMPATDMVPVFSGFSQASLLRAVMRGGYPGRIANSPGERVVPLVGGRALGRITGGNLSLACASLGTPFEISTEGKLLLLEEVGEDIYRIDRMLTQLMLAGKFARCGGVILGSFHGCRASDPGRSLTLLQVFRDTVCRAGKPVLLNIRTGHCVPQVTMPLGAQAVLDADAGTLTAESTVR